MQSEQLRHQYLAALGVTSWLPRAQLPAAPASPDWVASFIYDETSADSLYDETDDLAVDSLEVTAAPVAPVTAETLDLVPSRPSERVAVPEAPLQARAVAEVEPQERLPVIELAPQADVDKAPRFRLSFWVFEEVLVVDTLPPQSRGIIPDKGYQTLCSNLLRAMGYASELQAENYKLAWPMLAGETLSQGKEEALKAVHYKLNKILDNASPRLMLLLGESAAQLIMKRDESIEDMRGLVFSFTSQIRAISTHSLTQMMQIPECKKDVWKDLQKVLKTHD